MTVTNDILWDIVKGLFLVSWGLVLWEANRFMKRMTALEARVQELHDWRVAQTTRRHTWEDMGKPERRKG